MARRTKEEALATRERLLDAAEALFHRDGVAATSLADIAREAGLTRGAIYWHFTDKADLFNAMLARVTMPMECALQTEAQAAADPLQAVRDAFMRALQHTVDDAKARRVFDICMHRVEYVGELQAVRERYVSTLDVWIVRTEHGLRQAMRRGQIGRRMPARAAAIGLQALLAGLLRTWLIDPKSFALVPVGRQVLDGFLAGLAPPAEPAGASAPAAVPATTSSPRTAAAPAQAAAPRLPR